MRADYVIVGGFLGAGKTTALLKLAEHYAAAGRAVGLITNDQGQGLVDTSLARATGRAVEEVAGGCFCCRFGSLMEAAQKLSRDVRPDVFLAEPVGSCTDLRATVQYPLRQLHGDRYNVAPLSVLVDPLRAARVLGLAPGRSFSPKVQYIYEKQLEDADIVVINKSDVLDARQRTELERAIASRFPGIAVVAISARTGANLDEWLALLSGTPSSRSAMDVDYDVYADGEALLGWVNATCRVSASRAFDGNEFLRRVTDRVQSALAQLGLELAHFKMTLSPETGHDLAVINLVRTDGRPESLHRLAGDLSEAELGVNLRAEGDPATLHEIVLAALRDVARENGIGITIDHSEYFRPGRPVPTHRVTVP